MNIFLNSVKETLQAELDWSAHRKIDAAITELNAMRPNQREDAKQTDDGFFEYTCKLCGNDFGWFESWGEPKFEWCHECKEKKITELEAIATDLEKKLKAAQADTKRLVFEAGSNEMECMECGEVFKAERKVVRTVRAFCDKHIPADLKGADTVELDYEPELPKGPRISITQDKIEERSQSQKTRRTREKHQLPEHECAYCGKPSHKLYCGEECRKKHEKVVFSAEPIVPKELLTANSDMSSSEEDWKLRSTETNKNIALKPWNRK